MSMYPEDDDDEDDDNEDDENVSRGGTVMP